VIKQRTLIDILIKRDLVAGLRRQYEQEAADLDRLEDEVKQGLAAGAIVEPGSVVPGLAETARRSVSWKDAYVRALGQAAADFVVAHTTPKTSTELVLVDRNQRAR
jgi:hypothetical protein